MTSAAENGTSPALVAALLFVLSFAYFCLFLRYGINLEDEGALLYKFERMADGQRAYVDFHLGYTPGVYYIHSSLQGMFDQSIVPGRIALALTNSASVALLGLLVLPFAGIAGALAAGICYLALAPVHAGFFASFNIPYPTSYSVTIFLAGLLACAASYLRRRSDAHCSRGAWRASAFCSSRTSARFSSHARCSSSSRP